MSTTAYPPNREPRNPGAASVRRFVNDEMARAGSRFDASDDLELEFLCECGDLSCRETLKMTLADYRASRSGSIVGHD